MSPHIPNFDDFDIFFYEDKFLNSFDKEWNKLNNIIYNNVDCNLSNNNELNETIARQIEYQYNSATVQDNGIDFLILSQKVDPLISSPSVDPNSPTTSKVYEYNNQVPSQSDDIKKIDLDFSSISFIKNEILEKSNIDLSFTEVKDDLNNQINSKIRARKSKKDKTIEEMKLRNKEPISFGNITVEKGSQKYHELRLKNRFAVEKSRRKQKLIQNQRDQQIEKLVEENNNLKKENE
jgi:hypothetical protein